MSDEETDRDQIQLSETRFDAWMQIATKFFILANSGAAIATLSFLATQSGCNGFPVLAIPALACFVIGIIVAGFAIMGQLTAAYRAVQSFDFSPEVAETSISKSWATRNWDKAEPRTGSLMTLAFGLFIFGCALGLAGLAVAYL